MSERDYFVAGVARGFLAVGIIAGTIMQSWWLSGSVAIVVAALAAHALLKALHLYVRSEP